MYYKQPLFTVTSMQCFRRQSLPILLPRPLFPWLLACHFLPAFVSTLSSDLSFSCYPSFNILALILSLADFSLLNCSLLIASLLKNFSIFCPVFLHSLLRILYFATFSHFFSSLAFCKNRLPHMHPFFCSLFIPHRF